MRAFLFATATQAFAVPSFFCFLRDPLAPGVVFLSGTEDNGSRAVNEKHPQVTDRLV